MTLVTLPKNRQKYLFLTVLIFCVPDFHAKHFLLPENVVGLKTHAKMLLITRKEGKHLMRYGHLSTGNYNAKTAKLYTDLSYLTANPALTEDM